VYAYDRFDEAVAAYDTAMGEMLTTGGDPSFAAHAVDYWTGLQRDLDIAKANTDHPAYNERSLQVAQDGTFDEESTVEMIRGSMQSVWDRDEQGWVDMGLDIGGMFVWDDYLWEQDQVVDLFSEWMTV
jgi:hypothetical protein